MMERPSASSRQTLPGSVIADRYRLVAPLGEGGMGQVFEAEHVELGRRFALKVLRLESWSDTLVARFRREAQALARLSTPHVAQVTDFGVDPSVGPFYVMELVAGETLEDRLERGVLSPAEAARIGRATASALAEVHASGLIHRDLKPSNIALPERGPIDVKLLDFGLVAAVDDSFMTRITKSQQVLGSLPYMPPEAFDGAAPAPQMDLYSLGASLYEGLSGSLPFFAPSTAAMIHQILTAPVPPLVSRVEGVPPQLVAVLERLLAKDPAERYPDAATLEAAFDEVLKRGVASIPPTVLAPAAVPPTILSPAEVVTAPAREPLDSASTSPALPSQAAVTAPTPATRSTTRFVLLAFVAGLVLAGLAAVTVVLLLDATGDDDLSTDAPATSPIAPAVAPVQPTVEAENTSAVLPTNASDEEHLEDEAPVVADSEEGSSNEAAADSPPRRRTTVRRVETGSPATTPTATAMQPMTMRSTWRGERAIVDDSEFD